MSRILIVLLLLLPAPAMACGGLFCNSVALQPVDQKKERILFEVNGNGTVTAHVEIAYEGEASEFSWVVPVPDTPTLEVVPASTLFLLELATTPQILTPPIDWSGPWWGDDDDSAGADDDDFNDDDDSVDGDDDDSVLVEDLPSVGPFDPTVISSTNPDALIDWLNTNGYLITPEMEPFVADYVAMGMKFLAMKLEPDAGVEDISPIKMTYPATQPMVPIKLTAVAAEPQMQVLVFIAGADRYESSNYANISLPESELRADPRNGDRNYFGLLSWRIDQAGGQAFVQEWSGNSADAAALAAFMPLTSSDAVEAQTYLDDLALRQPFLTRMLTRLDADEMTVDPTFQPTTTQPLLGRTRDLTSQPAVWWNQVENPPLDCNELYCGAGAECASTNFSGRDGCVCGAGSVARLVDEPSLTSTTGFQNVTCVDLTFNVMPSTPASAPDPCNGWTCGGNGACVALNGAATCQCDPGYAAVWDWQNFPLPDRLIECTAIVQTYPPEQLLWPGYPVPYSAGDDDDATGDDDDATGDDDDATGDDDDTTDDDDDDTTDDDDDDDDDVTADDDDVTADDDDVTADDDDDVTADDDDDDADDGDSQGCAAEGSASCRAAGGAGSSSLAMLLMLGWRRRREGAARGNPLSTVTFE